MTLGRRPCLNRECEAVTGVDVSSEGIAYCRECGTPHEVGHDVSEGRVYPHVRFAISHWNEEVEE